MSAAVTASHPAARASRALSLAGVLAGMFAVEAPAAAQALFEPPVLPLLQQEPVRSALQAARKLTYVRRAFAARLDAEALQRDSLVLELLPAQKVTLVITETMVMEDPIPARSRQVKIGRIAEFPRSHAILFVRGDGSVSGRITWGDNVFSVNPLRADPGLHLILETDPRKLGPEAAPLSKSQEQP